MTWVWQEVPAQLPSGHTQVCRQYNPVISSSQHFNTALTIWKQQSLAFKWASRCYTSGKWINEFIMPRLSLFLCTELNRGSWTRSWPLNKTGSGPSRASDGTSYQKHWEVNSGEANQQHAQQSACEHMHTRPMKCRNHFSIVLNNKAHTSHQDRSLWHFQTM